MVVHVLLQVIVGAAFLSSGHKCVLFCPLSYCCDSVFFAHIFWFLLRLVVSSERQRWLEKASVRVSMSQEKKMMRELGFVDKG